MNRKIFRGLGWQVSTSIILTILLLVISCGLAVKFWQREKDAEIYVLIVTFAIFNVLETFLSLKLLLEKAAFQYNNSLKIAVLVMYLRRKKILEEDWLDTLDLLPLEKDIINDIDEME